MANPTNTQDSNKLFGHSDERSYTERSSSAHTCTTARITAIVLICIAIAAIVGAWVGLRCGQTGAWASTGVAMALLLVATIIGFVSCRKSSEQTIHRNSSWGQSNDQDPSLNNHRTPLNPFSS